MAAALVETPPPAPSSSSTTTTTPTKHMSKSAHSCPQCGTAIPLDLSPEDAQQRIAALEAQIELLKEKATAAVDKCADYEDQLRSSRSHQILRTSTIDSLDPDPPRPSTASSNKQSRFSFLTSRLPAVTPASLAPQSNTLTHTPSHTHHLSAPTIPTEILTELTKERELRAKAEARAQKVDSEIEELSVQLFSQANEMVATERKARAKLEARVEMLEKKDRDKMARLERLEKAVQRVERVKMILGTPVGAK